MNIVLFGAGASVDQAGPGKPPVVGKLYVELKRRCAWSNLPDKLESLFSIPETFEAGMTQLIEDAFRAGTARMGNLSHPSGRGSVSVRFKPCLTFDPSREEAKRWSRLQWDLAEFFFEFHAEKPNLYDRFFEAVSVSDLLSLRVATLNYDRLLQLAAHSRGIGMCYCGEPNLAEPLALCLPHGTSYLAPAAQWRDTPDGISPQGRGVFEMVGIGNMISHDGPLIELKSLDELRIHRSKGFFPPAISYIDPSKSPASGRSFLEKQRDVWCSWLEQAEQEDRLAIVGVRVRDEGAPDEHIWEPLRKTKARILYVNRDPEQKKAFESWVDRGEPRSYEVIPKTWNAAFDEVIQFLRPR